MRFADSHVHLGDYLDASPAIRFAGAHSSFMIAAGTGRENSGRTLELARLHPAAVRAFVGVHPSEAAVEGEPEWLDGMLANADGLGEVGLDPKYPGAGGVQLAVFRRQLTAAEKASKPVQVHTRDAEGACLEELSTFRLGRVLLHWFEGEGFLATAAGRGYFISVGPAVIYSKKLSRIAKSYPEDLLLTESDGPVAFAPLDGAGGPTIVPSVVFRLAALRRRTFPEAAALTFRNAVAFLGGEKVNHRNQRGGKV